MSNNEWKIANSTEMDKRKDIANDFYNKIIDLEEHPMFCSDKACFYDLYFGDPDEAKEIILKQYGFKATDADLTMPFWKLLDILYSKK